MIKFDFTDKVILITGGFGGIGLATAKMFKECGAKVVIADINPETPKVAQKLEILGLVVDISNEEQVKNMVKTVVEYFGKLDFAYNNVGIHAPVLPIDELESKDFDRVIDVNLKGCFLCMKYELKEMKKHRTGAIVNCSSQSGIVGISGLSAYTASKHAIIGMSKCAALEYAREGIRINVLCPGTSDTPMVANAIKNAPEHMAKIIDEIPLGRTGKAEEIASAVLYMMSDNAKFMIGHSLVADGGFTIG